MKGAVLILPAEAHELPAERDEPFLTSLSYAHRQIQHPAQAAEFHALARAIAGETADARTEIEVFRHYYQQLKAEAAPDRTLGAMRELAAEMARLETRDSVEVAHEMMSLSAPDSGGELNTAARKVRIDEDTLRLPAGLSFEMKLQLVSRTLPAIDRQLESGRNQREVVEAIDAASYQPELPAAEQESRRAIGRILKGYVAERLKDPETRALNQSAAFRDARAPIVAAQTPEELNHAAREFLRRNLADAKLNAPERNLLFFGRAPDHHMPEMRDLRHAWGLSRAERAARVQALREGTLTPSATLKEMLSELDSRRTLPALRHYQAAMLNEEMRNPGRTDLRPMYERLPPHERSYLIREIEERKLAFEARSTPMQERNETPSGRAFGAPPLESPSYREYLASLTSIEHRLLKEAAQKRLGETETSERSAAEARALLPREEQIQIRHQARHLAWDQLTPPEGRSPQASEAAKQLGDVIAHLREETQQHAWIAQQTLNEFLRGKNPNLQQQKALEEFAVKTREELYRGFEAVDRLREKAERSRELNTLPDRDQIPSPQFPNDGQIRPHSSGTVDHPSVPDRWSVDSLREQIPPAPFSISIDTTDKEHEYGYER